MFREIFTPKSKVLILEVLVEDAKKKYTTSEIADKADIGKDKVCEHLAELIEAGIVMEVGEIGNSMYYTLDTRDNTALLITIIDDLQEL